MQLIHYQPVEHTATPLLTLARLEGVARLLPRLQPALAHMHKAWR